MNITVTLTRVNSREHTSKQDITESTARNEQSVIVQPVTKSRLYLSTYVKNILFLPMSVLGGGERLDGRGQQGVSIRVEVPGLVLITTVWCILNFLSAPRIVSWISVLACLFRQVTIFSPCTFHT